MRLRRERRGFWIAFCAVFFYPTGWLVGRSRFEGLRHIPAEGGVLLVANHISHLDPIFSGLVVDKAGRVPRFLAKHSLWRVPVLGQALRGSAADPGLPRHRRRPAEPARGRRGAGAGPVGDHLPGGHDHPRPRRLADAGPHRRRPARAGRRRAGGADGALGHPRGARRLPEPVPAAAPQADHRALRRAGRPVRLPRAPGRRGAAARGHRPDHGRGCATCSPRSAASRRPPSSTAARGRRDRRERQRAEIRRVAVLGAGSWGTTFAKVLADAGRECGCGRAGPRSPPRSTTATPTPTTCPASSCPRCSPRPPTRGRAGRRRRGGARRAVADAAGQPDRLARAAAAGRAAGQPGQGRRAGHAGADERGGDRGRRRRPRTRWPC